MSDKDAILEKIKKLLRMKRGGTPDEVATALALAAELARKHGIDLDGVNPNHEPDQPIGHIDATTSARIQWECKYSGLICQTFFNITVLVRQAWLRAGWRYRHDYKLTFIGTKRDIEIALYVYHFLVRQFRHCWRTKTSRYRNRQAFMYGMYHGICSKLYEQRKQHVTEHGLILIGRALALRNAYMKNTWGDTESQSGVPDCDAAAAKMAGYLAGRKTEIRAGLNRSGKSVLAISN